METSDIPRNPQPSPTHNRGRVLDIEGLRFLETPNGKLQLFMSFRHSRGCTDLTEAYEVISARDLSPKDYEFKKMNGATVFLVPVSSVKAASKLAADLAEWRKSDAKLKYDF